MVEIKIKIGKTEYTIKYVNRISQNKKKQKYTAGQIDYDKKIIKIIQDHKGDRDVLFHELTHGIFFEAFKENPQLHRKLFLLKSDERFIQKLSDILKEMFEIKQKCNH